MAKSKETDDDKLIRLLLKKVGPVDMDLVIGEMVASGKYLIKLGEKRVSDNEAISLKKEAEMLTNMRLYRILTETLRYQAQKRMFLESQSAADVFLAGKFLLHAISTLEHLVRACQNPLLLSDQKVPQKVINRSVGNKG